MKPVTTLDTLLQYGVNSELAERATNAGLSVTKIRPLSKSDIEKKYGFTPAEAAELKKCSVRQPIEQQVVDLLLDHSNHLCCVCKGTKGSGVILHHIVEYEVSQDNSYANLAVLCPNDHDRAHSSGVTLGLSRDQIRNAKTAWESKVEIGNAQAAARAIQVREDAIDYVNIMRIEEMCLSRLGKIPDTTIGSSLRQAGILGPNLRFDEAHVRKERSHGGYLFDYANSGETEHYRQLLEKLSSVVMFEDLSEAARSGIRKLRRLEGKYAYFIGGVHSKQPKMPIDKKSQPLVFFYTYNRVRITWDGDPNYLMSMSAISRQGRTNRYIIYGLVRTVHQENPKDMIEVTVSPLLIAQPTAYVTRTPAIAWHRRWAADNEEDEEGRRGRIWTI